MLLKNFKMQFCALNLYFPLLLCVLLVTVRVSANICSGTIMLIKRFRAVLLLALMAVTNCYANSQDYICHPLPENHLSQYIVGYGSLMETKSKNNTDPTSGANRPVIVDNYQRGWLARESSIKLSTTYLAVIENSKARLNAVIFRLASPDLIKKYDQREINYCRALVPDSFIHPLNNQPLPKGQYWIYKRRPEFVAKPSARYPIVESYVDVFLSGCLEVEKKFHLKSFTEECINTTTDWSPYWVNDRIYPRRPFVFQPNALTIDKVLSTLKPEMFNKIKIEH